MKTVQAWSRLVRTTSPVRLGPRASSAAKTPCTTSCAAPYARIGGAVKIGAVRFCPGTAPDSRSTSDIRPTSADTMAS